jgi:predicted protein tyrosine phosphatase
MWIENVSLDAITKGFHFDPGPNSMLIQIVDPDMNFPVPLFSFKEIHQFKFLDIEEDDPAPNEVKITDEQAMELVGLLDRAKDQWMNVIVHCVAGICRSGAVAEIGVIMGFDDTKVFRMPNMTVKRKMLKCLTAVR